MTVLKRGMQVRVLTGSDAGRVGVIGSVSRKHGLVTVFIEGVDDAYRFGEVEPA